MSSINCFLLNIVKLTGWFFLPLSALSAADLSTTASAAWQQVRADQYVAPAHSELQESKKLFAELLKGNLSQDLEILFNKINFRLDRYKSNAENIIVVRENKPPYQGLGMFIIRLNGNGIMLQAPHAFKDLHTGQLAIHLMLEGNYSALAINTVPRSYLSAGIKQEPDMAHMYNTHFISISHAFSDQYPNGQIVQLHGFNSARRPATISTAMIISAGVKKSDSKVQQQQKCLARTIKGEVKAYPDDINILGGTTNSIGRYLRARGFSAFRHYEMNLPTRKVLLKQKDLRGNFSECIVNDH